MVRRGSHRVEFGGQVGDLGRADPLEDLQCLLQLVACLGGMTDGSSAPAQSSQCVRLVPGAADLAGQVQRLLVA